MKTPAIIPGLDLILKKVARVARAYVKTRSTAGLDHFILGRVTGTESTLKLLAKSGGITKEELTARFRKCATKREFNRGLYIEFSGTLERDIRITVGYASVTGFIEI